MAGFFDGLLGGVKNLGDTLGFDGSFGYDGSFTGDTKSMFGNGTAEGLSSVYGKEAIADATFDGVLDRDFLDADMSTFANQIGHDYKGNYAFGYPSSSGGTNLLGGLAGLSKDYGSGNVLQDLTNLGGLYTQYEGMRNAEDQAEWVRNQYDAREKERKKKQGLAQASMTNSFNRVYG
jgi:hypothetical protein